MCNFPLKEKGNVVFKTDLCPTQKLVGINDISDQGTINRTEQTYFDFFVIPYLSISRRDFSCCPRTNDLKLNRRKKSPVPPSPSPSSFLREGKTRPRERATRGSAPAPDARVCRQREGAAMSWRTPARVLVSSELMDAREEDQRERPSPPRLGSLPHSWRLNKIGAIFLEPQERKPKKLEDSWEVRQGHERHFLVEHRQAVPVSPRGVVFHASTRQLPGGRAGPGGIISENGGPQGAHRWAGKRGVSDSMALS